MNWLVVPLRFDAPLPPKPLSIATQLFAHIVLVGIPIALITARFLKPRTRDRRYSGTPLAKKLSAQGRACACWSTACRSASGTRWRKASTPGPTGSSLPEPAARCGAHLRHRARRAGGEGRRCCFRCSAASGFIWVSWPKKASKVPTDITEDTIRDVCLPMGLVDVKVCAVDATWSGLKLDPQRCAEFTCEWFALSIISISMIVCVCNRITESEVRKAARCGATTPEAAYACHGCEVQCGCCLDYAQEVIDEERGQAPAPPPRQPRAA